MIDPIALSSDLGKVLDYIELPYSESERLGLTNGVVSDIITHWLTICEIEAHKGA